MVTLAAADFADCFEVTKVTDMAFSDSRSQRWTDFGCQWKCQPPVVCTVLICRSARRPFLSLWELDSSVSVLGPYHWLYCEMERLFRLQLMLQIVRHRESPFAGNNYVACEGSSRQDHRSCCSLAKLAGGWRLYCDLAAWVRISWPRPIHRLETYLRTYAYYRWLAAPSEPVSILIAWYFLDYNSAWFIEYLN